MDRHRGHADYRRAFPKEKDKRENEDGEKTEEDEGDMIVRTKMRKMVAWLTIGIGPHAYHSENYCSTERFFSIP